MVAYIIDHGVMLTVESYFTPAMKLAGTKGTH